MSKRGALISQILNNLNALEAVVKNLVAALTRERVEEVLKAIRDIKEVIQKKDLTKDDLTKINFDLIRRAMEEGRTVADRLSAQAQQAAPITKETIEKVKQTLESRLNKAEEIINDTEALLDQLTQSFNDEEEKEEEQPQPSQPTTSPSPAELIEAVEAFVSLINTLTELYDEYPIITQRKQEFPLRLLIKYETAWAKVEEKIKVIERYTGLTFPSEQVISREQAVDFLTQARQKLENDIETFLMRRESTTQRLQKNASPEEKRWKVELTDAYEKFRKITPADIEEAALILEIGKKLVPQWESFKQELPRNFRWEDLALTFLSVVSGIPIKTRYERQLRTIAEIINEGSGRKIEIERKRLEEEQKRKPRKTIFEIYDELWGELKILLDALYRLTPLKVPENIPDDLKRLFEGWKIKGRTLQDKIGEYSSFRYKPPSGRILGEIEKLRKVGLLEALSEFLEATKQLQEKLGVKDRKKLFPLLSKLIKIENLLRQLLFPEQASKSFAGFARFLPPSLGDLKRQQWLIEEKHTL